MSYLTTSGPESNGVRTFVFSGVLENPQGVSPNSFNVSITSTVAAAGGEEIESTEKIRYTAPKAYGTQDRAVTADDYSAIVRQVYQQPVTSSSLEERSKIHPTTAKSILY